MAVKHKIKAMCPWCQFFEFKIHTRTQFENVIIELDYQSNEANSLLFQTPIVYKHIFIVWSLWSYEQEVYV